MRTQEEEKRTESSDNGTLPVRIGSCVIFLLVLFCFTSIGSKLTPEKICELFFPSRCLQKHIFFRTCLSKK